jgi:hypothetical protein
MEIAKLYAACQCSWDADTSYNEDYAHTVRSTSAERSYGQCAVTSLVVDDHHPGQFFQATVRWSGACAIHYWIESWDYGELDFTWDQFPVYAARTNVERVARAQLLPVDNQWMHDRYELLSARVARLMKSDTNNARSLSFSSPEAQVSLILS